MQLFRNMSQPGSHDLRNIAGYANLSEQQKMAAFNLFQEAVNRNSATKGIRIASEMAFAIVEREIKNLKEGSELPKMAPVPQVHASTDASEAGKHYANELPDQASVPQAHTSTDATPAKDEHEDELMKMVGDILKQSVAATTPDPEGQTSDNIQKHNRQDKEAKRTK
jgi:hypothetical protein